MTVKVTLNLTENNIQSVDFLSKQLNINKTTVVNYALLLEKLLYDEFSSGKKFFIEDCNGTQLQVDIFNSMNTSTLSKDK